jgi:hypothetical protein
LGPHEKGKDEGGAQDGRLTMTGAEKYAEVCREGAVLGTGRCSLMTPSTKQGMLPLKLKRLVFATYASHSNWLLNKARWKGRFTLHGIPQMK